MTPEQIATLRRQTGLSQPRFAARLIETDPYIAPNGASISRWERGKLTPHAGTVDALTRLWLDIGYPVTATLHDGTTRPGTLTTNHSASSYGQPVVVIDGTAHGAGDVAGIELDDAPDAIVQRARAAGFAL